MSTSAADLVTRAFERLSARPGFTKRPDQLQLALLLSDLIENKRRGAFEAPTGLGKSLAALIPALANAAVHGTRVVIGTYTNVLAEQYWRQDWPLARQLFAEMDVEVDAHFLIGRQRYACLAAMKEAAPDLVIPFRNIAELGIESEFREIPGRAERDLMRKWVQVTTPPVCPARLCPYYHDCFYYQSRRKAMAGKVVITNHSVVLTDAMFSQGESTEGLLGTYDFLILDEAHDFAQAAVNSLEFELSIPKMRTIAGIDGRLEQTFAPLAQRLGQDREWSRLHREFRGQLERSEQRFVALGLGHDPAILAVSPTDVADHPQVKSRRSPPLEGQAFDFAESLTELTDAFLSRVKALLADWKELRPEETRQLQETAKNYLWYIGEFGSNCRLLSSPRGVSVSYFNRQAVEPILRMDTVGIAEPLREMIWDKMPYACLSATLALDNDFAYIQRTLGIEPDFQEILPSPFDFASQAAVYVPPSGRIPDPTVARREGSEEIYYRALAAEVEQIISTLGGRTLVLFHSRKEMEGTRAHVQLPAELPILMQTRTGVARVGEQFRAEVNASLFALRSFWTGFDAPGETLSCVVLVRVPFEVPTDPPQVARLAWMQSIGLDPFAYHTLPGAKMLMRQGAGRLIRRTSDRGIIALLDPRLRSKRYGEEILANLPREMRTFEDFRDAAGWVGLGS